jgi:hypothetical protein
VSTIPVQPQGDMNLVGLTLENVRQFGPLLVVSFLGEMHLMFTPVPDEATGTLGVRATVARGALPFKINKALESVLPEEAQVVLNRVVLSQEMRQDIGGIVFGFDDELSLSVSMAQGIVVTRAGVNVVPKVVH